MTGEDGLVKVLKTAGRLKKEMRRGWVVKAGIPNPESVADHTFRTVLLAMLLGDSRHFDTEKMMRMALIHDLGEAVMGDITPIDVKRLKTKGVEESNVIKQILSPLPELLREKYLQIWRELCDSSSEEARLVADLDKLEMALQAAEYIEEGYSKEVLGEFKVSAIQRIEDAELIDLISKF
jgi:putative hydrolase of HD superfamily